MMLSKPFVFFNPLIYKMMLPQWFSLFRMNAIKSVMYFMPLRNYTRKQAKRKMMISVSGVSFPYSLPGSSEVG